MMSGTDSLASASQPWCHHPVISRLCESADVLNLDTLAAGPVVRRRGPQAVHAGGPECDGDGPNQE